LRVDCEQINYPTMLGKLWNKWRIDQKYKKKSSRSKVEIENYVGVGNPHHINSDIDWKVTLPSTVTGRRRDPPFFNQTKFLCNVVIAFVSVKLNRAHIVVLSL
jgi:hypothetical protein